MLRDKQGNALAGDVVAIDSTNCVGRSEGRKVVLLGVSDLIVAESGQYILVCHRDKTQEIKGLPERLGVG